MNPVKPERNNSFLLNSFTSGYFLESPDRLQKALEMSKEWETYVPGSNNEVFGVSKRMSTIEQSLMQLRSELVEEYNQDESFEIDSKHAVPRADVKVNIESIKNRNDPIVVLVRHGRTPHSK